jgi:methylated-DNA-[protein]-cysteine S-methyltransferase
MRYSYIESPLGDLLVTRDDGGLTGLCLPTGRYRQRVRDEWERDDGAFDHVRRELDEYFAGTLQDFTVPLSPRGSTFQKQVWQALSEIPYGETTSYGKVAASIGHPDGARAVGVANGQNPIPIIVPCHRVIGADGSLTGYGGGLDAKRWLLDHEARHAGLTLSL